MATGDFKVFDEWIIEAQAVAHPVTNDWKLGLISNATTPAETDADPHYGGTGTTNLATNEVTGGNVSAGGVALTTEAHTEAAGTATWNSDNVTVTQNGANPTCRWGILYDNTDVNKKAMGFYDFGADRDLSTGNLTLTTSSGWWTSTTA